VTETSSTTVTKVIEPNSITIIKDHWKNFLQVMWLKQFLLQLVRLKTNSATVGNLVKSNFDAFCKVSETLSATLYKLI
jgi:hypothetical protein